MNAHERLLEALGGDTSDNRRLINDLCHQMADLAQQMYLFGHGEKAIWTIDPYLQTRDEWNRVTRYNGAKETDGLHKPEKPDVERC